MEVFAAGFPEEFREVHSTAVEEMQEILGRANDSYVAANRLRDLRRAIETRLPKEWKRYKAGIEGLLRFHEERLPQEREHFEAWWRRWQRSGGEGALVGMLQQEQVVGG